MSDAAVIRHLKDRIADLEAEYEQVSDLRSRWQARAEKAEAEVERLRDELTLALEGEKVPFPGRGGRKSETPGGGTSPSGVSPSPPGDDTNAALELARVLSEQGIESVLTPRFKLNGKPVTVAAAEPAAPFPECAWCGEPITDGRTAMGRRKGTVVHLGKCPAARKEA